MIEFDILNRYTKKVQFTAEIDCKETADHSTKVGLAVEWALRKEVDLRGTDLRRADLEGVDLKGANLRRAELACADLKGADLRRAELAWADMTGANLEDANLTEADLRCSNLKYTKLTGAKLKGTKLSHSTDSFNPYIKFMMVNIYHIVYTHEVMCIGCEQHAIKDWRNFSDRQILEMDGKKALQFWHKAKTLIFQIIELDPAIPTNHKNSNTKAA